MTNKTKRQNTDNLVKDTVADFLIENPDYSGSKLKKLVESQLRARGFRYDFTVRTYENIKKQLGEPRQDLDKDWSLGTDEKFPISPLAINSVIAIQRLLLKVDKQLTIRRALRTAKLNPILSEILSKEYPIEEERDLTLLQIASLYVRMEQIAEQVDPKKKYTETKYLDKIFLIDRDVSFETILLEWLKVFLPTPIEKQQGNQSSLHIESEQSTFIGIVTMPGSIEEKKNEILLLVNGDPDKKVEGHPELKIEILRLMATSTRKDIEGWMKNNNTGEGEAK
jgi:hypothetical protein